MLVVDNLTCTRDNRSLFNDLSFSLSEGEILQIAGANGSGKTTLLKILVGLFTNYEGEITWAIDSAPLYVGHKLAVSGKLTVVENLGWLTGVTADNEIDQALQVFGLDGYQRTLCLNLSEGQRKRVALARLKLSRSQCWILDEPFSALDTEGLGCLEASIDDHVNTGGSVVLTSHQPLNLGVTVRQLELGV